jgi:hypothetical protein
MRNTRGSERPGTLKVLAGGLLVTMGLIVTTPWIAAAQAAAQAADCPRKDALGTSRILKVDAATTPRVGLKSFPQTLPLADHEVVLTFDDGPWPPTTTRVLAALAHECVEATFFLIGKSASEHPELVRRIAAGGHSIGHHTWSHRNLKHIRPNEALEEIDRGIAADEMALHGVATTTPSTPFFAFPALNRRRRPSISCNRAASWCSAPMSGPATGIARRRSRN